MSIIFSGLPSKKLPNRPFFSIIVSCTNPEEFTISTFLDSIKAHDMNDEIEIILVDNKSVEGYQDSIDKYKDILSIKQLRMNKAEYSMDFGATKELGLTVAEGKWITFANIDDIFVEKSLNKVKEAIIRYKIETYISTNIIPYKCEFDNIDKTINEKAIYGKFYNLDNFWNKYKLGFNKLLKTHESEYIDSNIFYLKQNNIIKKFDALSLDIDCYCRYINLNDKNKYFENTLNNFINSTFGVYIEKHMAYMNNSGFNEEELTVTFKLSIEIFLYCYFYIQSFKSNNSNYKRENEFICREFFSSMKRVFQLSNSQIYNFIRAFLVDTYLFIRSKVLYEVGGYVETESLKEWMNRLEADFD